MSPEGLKTALHDLHVAAGGKMVPFAGWIMPVQYSSILDEHRAVRECAGLFDVSHMGEIEVAGPDRFTEVDRITTAKTLGKDPGFVQYALLLTEEAGIIDDILVYVLPERIVLVVNAANREKDYQWVLSRATGNVEVVDRSMEVSQIAIQGPASRDLVDGTCGDDAARSLDYYRSAETTLGGVAGTLSRTGYTGEFGYEFYCAWDDGPAVWRALLDAGSGVGARPVGLGARDSLRLEMAYCLWGNDIDETTNPVEAGLRWTVKAKKVEWIGKEAYLAAKSAEGGRRLVGFRLGPREIPRPGYEVVHEGHVVGTATSGGFSPSCGAGIALGYVPASLADEEDGFSIRIRKRDCPATPVRGSFVTSSAKAGEEE